MFHQSCKRKKRVYAFGGGPRTTTRRAEGSFTSRMKMRGIVDGCASEGYQLGSVGAAADDATALEGKQESSALGLAWPALLAQAQANRELAEACRDTARAVLHAMQTQCAPCALALQSTELHCWYIDAKDYIVVNVAQQSLTSLSLLGAMKARKLHRSRVGPDGDDGRTEGTEGSGYGSGRSSRGFG